MKLTTPQGGPDEVDGDSRSFNESERESVLRELNAILSSPIFLPSKRGQQFLSYVVRHRLEGNRDRLKERTIGVDLFHRPVGYATGDDPVVRVQAGEVRRRLDQYYQSNHNSSEVRIELHVGSYTPEFKWVRSGKEMEHSSLTQPDQKSQETVQELTQAEAALPAETRHVSGKRKRIRWVLAAVALILIAALAQLGFTIYRAKTQESVLKKFWAPALSSSEPILICLAKPPVYRPSIKLYQRHSKTPEEFVGQFARLTQKPDLRPDDKLTWSDMEEYPDYGLAIGDVYTAIQLSSLFGEIGKKNRVRIGSDISFEDLRSSPAVVIGAFNSRWAMRMTSNLHFAFADEGDRSIIQESGPSGRKWHSTDDSNGKAAVDYAIVTRLLNSTTGQFVVIVAGIRSYGTQAAGEFVSRPESLQAALGTASPGWEGKNVQILLQTSVTDGLPAPPQVVATYIW